MTPDPLTSSVDTIAGKTGLTRDATAILFIVAGVLILIFEDLIRVILGVLLIVVGVVWLVQAHRSKTPSSPPPL